MQSCGFPSSTTSAFINSPCSYLNYDCDTVNSVSSIQAICETSPVQCLARAPLYRSIPSFNYVHPTSGKEKDFINTTTKHAIILQKKYHAYRKIWNCNKFKNTCDSRKILSGEGTKTASWKFWPPPLIVPVPDGLKIPIKYEKRSIGSENLNEYASDSPCCLPMPSADGNLMGCYVSGEDEIVEPIITVPNDEIEMTKDQCLRGVLNTHESEQFIVQPSSVLFLNSKIGQYDTIVVKVRNKGMFPRRMSVISPQSANFDVIWGAGVGENTLLAPGLTCKIIVRFNPPKSGRAINDMITIIIDEDGAIVVPIIAENSSKPILEMEEWDVGCSLVNNSRISTFDITNRGGDARFWILSEEEFMNEYLELRGPKPTQKLLSSRTGDKQDGNYSEYLGETDDLQLSLEKARLDEQKRRTELRDKMLSKADHLLIKPFKIFPSCFHLQRNQSITIQIRYRPREPAFHLKKLAMLCDNGEVRWLVVKGIGIDPKKNPLIEINGKWMAPPVDLPADLNTRITIDCGDLLPGEKTQECFTLKNNSCMPLYFFWSIRHIRPFGREMTTSNSHLMNFQPQGLLDRQEWTDFEDELNEIKNPPIPIPIKIYPAQGILCGRESLECSVFVQAPVKEGYHNCILSIFIQQIGEQAEEILTPMMKEINNSSKNNTPVAYESLIETFPKKTGPELPGKKWKKPKYKSGDKGISNFVDNGQKVYDKRIINEDEDLQEEEEEIGEGYEDFNYFTTAGYENKKKSSDFKKKRGECKQWTDKEWSLGPMYCPIICLERRAEYDDDGTKKQLSIVDPGGSIIKRQGQDQRKRTEDSIGTERSGKKSINFNGNGKETMMKFKSPKLNFPPMPFFYMVNSEMSKFDIEPTSFDVELRKLEFPKNILSRKILEKSPNWLDGESGDELDPENEFKYEDYFGKICISSTTAQIRKSTRESEAEEDDDEILENYEDKDENNMLKMISNPWQDTQAENGEFLGEDQNPVQNEEFVKRLSIPEEKEPKTIIDIVSKLEHDGCVLLHRFEEAKKWLDESSPLQPMEEIEIWSRTIPLQCSFDPPQLTAHGQYNHKVNRSIEFVNHTKHQVQLTLDPFISEVGTIICRPFDVTVDPWQSVVLHFTIDFRHKGNHEGTLGGTIKLPFTPPVNVPCWLPFRLMTDGPSISLITPIVNFGLIVRGTEHVKTIVLRNDGSIRTKWRATIPPENLQDEDSHELSYSNRKVNKLSLLRAWPECGTIEPFETLGIQIYLGGPSTSSSCSSSSQPQTLSACCEIQIEEDPEHTMYITILAEMQSPSVILLESRLVLRDVFKSVGNFSVRARLKNLRSFHTPFKWGKPIGAQAELCQISMSPSEGILPPKEQIICHIKFLSEESILLNNLFIPCSIGGLKEPLILKIEGAVFSLCLKIVIPKTVLSRIKENDLPWHCREEIWPKICGLSSSEQNLGEEENESKNDNCTKKKLYVNYLGKYGKYCLVRHFEIQAPPPSISGRFEERENAEEEEEEEGEEGGKEEEENNEEEHEEEEEEEELSAEKAVKGKKSKKLKVKKSKSKSKSTKEKESKTKQKGKKSKSKSKTKLKSKSKSAENTEKQSKIKKTKSKKTKSKLLKSETNANDKKEEDDEPKNEENKKEKTKEKKKKGKKSGAATPRKKKRDKNKEKEDAIEKQNDGEEEEQGGGNEEDEIEGEFEDGQKYQGEFRGENPFECLQGEDDQIETMTSEGRLIYFQIKKQGEVATVQFSIHNEAPVSTVFTFKVHQYPIKSEGEVEREKKLQPQRFIKLDSEFFEEYKKMERTVERENVPIGKNGAIFNVFPSEGILQAFHSVDVTLEFHANVSGLYEDQLECHFEGLDDPYIIKLEALAILCKEDDCLQNKPESSIPGEAGEPQEMLICTRKLNPLLY